MLKTVDEMITERAKALAGPKPECPTHQEEGILIVHRARCPIARWEDEVERHHARFTRALLDIVEGYMASQDIATRPARPTRGAR